MSVLSNSIQTECSSAAAVSRSRWINFLVFAVTAYIFAWTTLIPVLNFGFFGDDFAFLNWTSNLTLGSWLHDWLAPNHFNLTYRPIAMFVYLVYASASAPLCYALLAALYAINLLVLYYVFRKLSNPTIAALAILIFAGGFIYYDATHKVYNLITQLSALCFLSSLHSYLRRWDHDDGKGSMRFAYLAFALSLLTYEITLFGFLVFFAFAWVKLPARKVNGFGRSIFAALKASWGFAIISLCYLIVNFLSPIKAAHLREHAIPIGWSTVPVIISRAKNVFINTLAWMATLDQSTLKAEFFSVQWAISGFVFMAILTALLVAGPSIIRRGVQEIGASDHGLLMLTGLVWFVALLLPGAVSSYFDYRMTFLAYAGFSLLVAAFIHGVYIMLINAMPIGGDVASGGVAIMFSALLSIWLISNLSLTHKMNRNLFEASRGQSRILESMGSYLRNFKNDSVIVVQYRHAPNQDLPYPYQASPFAEDFALSEALKANFGETVADASLFFRPERDRFEIGRFAFAQHSYSYDRLILFAYENDRVMPQFRLQVSGSTITLPQQASQ